MRPPGRFSWSSALPRADWNQNGVPDSVDEAIERVQRRIERKAAGKDPFDEDESPHEPPTPPDRRYFNVTRSLSAGFIAALPLLAIYELGIARDINAAAFVAKWPIAWLRNHPSRLLGAHPMLVLNAALILITLIALVRLLRKNALHAGTFGGMFVESVVYALLLAPLSLFLMGGKFQLAGLAPNFDQFGAKLVASCGAGLYEELLFRVLLLGALYTLLKELAGLKALTAGVIALLLSGVVFSAAHFLAPGEPVELSAFLFRLIAGILLGIIFLTRGFGIAAWTHALYDLLVLSFAAQA